MTREAASPESFETRPGGEYIVLLKLLRTNWPLFTSPVHTCELHHYYFSEAIIYISIYHIRTNNYLVNVSLLQITTELASIVLVPEALR
jgi:hypothetical protein